MEHPDTKAVSQKTLRTFVRMLAFDERLEECKVRMFVQLVLEAYVLTALLYVINFKVIE